MPQLAPPPDARVVLPQLFCDSEVAFLHLPAGTDRLDHTLGTSLDHMTPPPESQVVEVKGNLWVLPSSQPLSIVLHTPLTLIVHGNVYLGRSVEVVGRGPLTIVAHRTGTTFRDLDGDGTRSPQDPLLGGPGIPALEGDGAVYFGLPGLADQPTLCLALNLVAEGEIHVLTAVRHHGALVGGHGLTACNDRARLELTGRCLQDVARTRIPGFATSGAPRPGVLHRSLTPFR
jgi:hypothetical protein